MELFSIRIQRTFQLVSTILSLNYFLFFPLVQSCTERLIIFLPIGLTVGPDKKAAKNVSIR